MRFTFLLSEDERYPNLTGNGTVRNDYNPLLSFVEGTREDRPLSPVHIVRQKNTLDLSSLQFRFSHFSLFRLHFQSASECKDEEDEKGPNWLVLPPAVVLPA